MKKTILLLTILILGTFLLSGCTEETNIFNNNSNLEGEWIIAQEDTEGKFIFSKESVTIVQNGTQISETYSIPEPGKLVIDNSNSGTMYPLELSWASP